MRMNQNLADVQENDFTVLPPGWYNAKVSDSEIKQSKKGHTYVAWTFELDNGRLVWDNMVLDNDVSLRRLKTMATAAGHPNPNYIADSEELHGKRLQIKLAIEEDESGQYEPKNTVKSFKPIDGAKLAPVPSPSAQPQAAQPAAPAAAKPKMPWER